MSAASSEVFIKAYTRACEKCHIETGTDLAYSVYSRVLFMDVLFFTFDSEYCIVKEMLASKYFTLLITSCAHEKFTLIWFMSSY